MMRATPRAVFAALVLAGCSTEGGSPVTPPPPPPPPGPPPPSPGLGPMIQAPTLVHLDEDTQVRTPLSAQRCPDARWSLAGTTNPDYRPALEGNVLIHQFAAGRSGSGAVSIRLECGTLVVFAAVQAVAHPQPDMTVTVRELAGADQLLPSSVRVMVNGIQTTIGPGGGRIQFKVGPNQLQLVSNPDFRALQVWEVNGVVVPLNEAATEFPLWLTSAGDDGSAVVRMLHATSHEWYRAGEASEQDVRTQYWADGSGGVGRGFVGYLSGRRNDLRLIHPWPDRALVVDGVEVCAAVPEARTEDYRAALAAQQEPYGSSPAPLGWSFQVVHDNLVNYTSLVGGEVWLANGWSLACDAPVSEVHEYHRPSSTGHVEQFVIRMPTGSSQANRIAALWRLPRKLGRRVVGSAWVSSGTQPGPSDRKVAEHFFPIADAAADRGMPPPRF